MSGKIYPLSLAELQRDVGAVIQQHTGSQTAHWWLSLAEALKDAERWAYVREHQVPPDLSPAALERFVDAALRNNNETPG